MRSAETPEEAICRLFLTKHTRHQIRDLTGIRFDKVSRVINYFVEHGHPPEPLQKGRPSLLTNSTLANIELMTTQNRFSTCSNIVQDLGSQGIDVSETTVWRVRKQFEFNFKPRWKVIGGPLVV